MKIPPIILSRSIGALSPTDGRAVGLAVLLAFFVPGLVLNDLPSVAEAQAPSLPQAGCIDQLNKAGFKLAQGQMKEAEGCLKSAASGKTEKLGEPPQDQTAQACLTNDVKGKLAKASAKLAGVETKRCLTAPAQLPDYGYTDFATVDLGARDAGTDLVADLFGADLDAAVVSASADKDAARCQAQILKGASKLYKTLAKETLKAKKEVLKCSGPKRSGKCDVVGISAVTSGLELETEIHAILDADAKGKLAKAGAGILKAADKSCTGLATPLATLFPGACSGVADTAALAGCVEMMTRGRSCLALNTFDSFTHDCGIVTALSFTPSAPGLVTRDSAMIAVSLDSLAPPAGFEVTLLSDDPALVGVAASVTVPAASSTAMIALTTGTGTGSTTIHATGGDVSPAAAAVTVSRRGYAALLTLIGVGRDHDFEIVLDSPAPVGGATLDLVVLDGGVATVTPAQVVIPAGQTTAAFQISGVAEGSTSLTVDGVADGYEFQTLPVTTTDNLVDLASSVQLAQGVATDILVLMAPDPAPVGGATISLASADPGVVEVLTPNVFIPEGNFDGQAQVRALVENSSTTLTASLSGHAPDTMTANTESALKIVETFSSFGELETDSVYVRLQDPLSAIPAPAGGVSVSLVSDDIDCVSVAASALIPEAVIHQTFDLSYGGVAALPCTATVTASNATFGSDTISVTIAAPPDLGAITVNPLTGTTRVGAGLQNRYRATLASGAHGGVTLQIETDDPSVSLVSPDGTTTGSPVLEIAVPNGTTFVDFRVQGVPGATGSSTVSVRQPRFTSGTRSAETETPVFDLLSVILTHNVSSLQSIPNDDFIVRTGLANVAGTAFQTEQPVSPGAGPLSVTVTSSDAAIADLTTPLQTGASVALDIAVDSSRTPAVFGSGGVAVRFPSLTTGTTTIAATAPGFQAGFVSAEDDVTVNVTPATITVSDSTGQNRLGGGLQVRYRATLNGGDHGGITVRVTSDTPAVALVAPADGVTAGAGFVDLFFADQDTSEDFFVQGVVGATGGFTLTATGPGFTDGVLSPVVEEPVLDILALTTSKTTNTAEQLNADVFQVRTGLRNTAGTFFAVEQVVSAAAGPLTVTATTSDTAVLQIGTQAGSGVSAQTTVSVNQSRSPGNITLGAVQAEFTPTMTGSADVTASAPGFLAGFDSADETVTVTVNPATITVSDIVGVHRMGGGLQGRYRVTLSGGDHGGVTVRVTSSDPATLLVAPDGGVTAGGAFVDLVFADQDTFEDFYVQGVVGATGNVDLTATAPGFDNGVRSVAVEEAVMDILSLTLSHTTTTVQSISQDAFQVRVGVANVAGTAFGSEFGVSAAAGTLTVAGTSSDIAVAQVANSGGSGASASTTIGVNSSRSPATVALGGLGVEFSPTSTGTSTIAVSAPNFAVGFDPADEDVSVTVNPASITVADSTGGERVGAGLQVRYRVTLSGGDHGGVTIRVTSDNPAAAIVAPGDGVSAGAAFVDLVFADQDTQEDFYLQGVAGTTGAATLTASAAGFTDALSE